MPEMTPCAATIWPSSSDRWHRCPGVIVRGHCSVYGSQHDSANAKAATPTTWTDRSDADDATFRAELDRIEAAPEAAEAWRAWEVPPWGDDHEFGETCRRNARLRDQLAEVIAEWMAMPHKPEDWQRNNADDLTADLLPYVHAYEDAAEQRGAERVAQRMRELADTYAFLGATLHNVPKAETFTEVADEHRAALADVAPQRQGGRSDE